MPWLRFTADHCWTPPDERRVSKLFKAGTVEMVRKCCADEAIRLGRAEMTVRPKAASE
jgi:hypothetical protein